MATQRRLVAILTESADENLRWLVKEEGINKTTTVMRAITLYAMIIKVVRAGGRVFLQEPGSHELERIHII